MKKIILYFLLASFGLALAAQNYDVVLLDTPDDKQVVSIDVKSKVGIVEKVGVDVSSMGNTVSLSFEKAEKSTISIFNIAGHMLREVQSSAQEVEINDLPKGMCIVKVKSPGVILAKKIIIK